LRVIVDRTGFYDVKPNGCRSAGYRAADEESMAEWAKEGRQRIQEAYERIRAARGARC
jgi:hypothetical protein